MTEVALSSAMLVRLLNNPETARAIPVLAPTIELMHGAAVGRCSACARRRKQVIATSQAKAALLQVPPEQRSALKRLMGIPQDAHLRVVAAVQGRLTQAVL